MLLGWQVLHLFFSNIQIFPIFFRYSLPTITPFKNLYTIFTASLYIYTASLSLLMQEKILIFLACVSTVTGKETETWRLLKSILVQMLSHIWQLGSCGFDYILFISNVPFSTSLIPCSRDTHQQCVCIFSLSVHADCMSCTESLTCLQVYFTENITITAYTLTMFQTHFHILTYKLFSFHNNPNSWYYYCSFPFNR